MYFLEVYICIYLFWCRSCENVWEGEIIHVKAVSLAHSTNTVTWYLHIYFQVLP